MVAATRVLVIEGEHFMREALVLAMTSEGYEVCDYEHGLAIEGILERHAPDLAIIDLNLQQGPDGLALTRRLRSWGDIPVILVSGSTRVDDRLAAFSAGADDFVLKPFSMSELRARVGVALRRSNRHQQRVLNVGDIVIDVSGHTVTRDGDQLDLRNIEFKLLEMFCRHPGQVLSKVQILEKVWGHAFSDVNLVEVHVSHLRRAIEKNGPRVIHTVRSVGYVLQPDREVKAAGRPKLSLAPKAYDASADGRGERVIDLTKLDAERAAEEARVLAH
jgi:DNA-binding response OmpR family regulator